MGRSNQSFNRRERERNKKLKADAKRERRQARPEPTADAEDGESGEDQVLQPPVVDEGAVLRQLQELTASFDAGGLDFEEYERRRTDLLAQLVVD